MIVNKAIVLMTLSLGIIVDSKIALGNAENCKDKETCLIDLPEAQCADGTPMYVQLVHRTHAKKLYIYLQGGGACWDSLTCDCHDEDQSCHGGLASRLTRQVPQGFLSGWSNPDLPHSPITNDYNIAEVPYCSGDSFLGNRLQNFGSAERPIQLRQFGYRNLHQALKKIKEHFPDPEEIVFMGASAGGLGVTFNMHQLREFYPSPIVHLISDAGTPFKSPFISRSGLDRLIEIWGVNDNLPSDYRLVVGNEIDFAGMIKYNARRFPNHRFAFLSSYNDWVMTSFSLLLGAQFGLSTHSKLIEDVAKTDLEGQQKVFYMGGNRHTFNDLSPSDVVSYDGYHLADWIDEMMTASASWQSHL